MKGLTFEAAKVKIHQIEFNSIPIKQIKHMNEQKRVSSTKFIFQKFKFIYFNCARRENGQLFAHRQAIVVSGAKLKSIKSSLIQFQLNKSNTSINRKEFFQQSSFFRNSNLLILILLEEKMAIFDVEPRAEVQSSNKWRLELQVYSSRVLGLCYYSIDG